MSTTVTPLLPGNWYHIYNRGINGETIFSDPRNYEYFLQLLVKHVLPVIEVFACCLLRNHFHLLVRILEEIEKQPHRAFSNWFNSYAQAFNKQQGRTGSLFERPFHRKLITSEKYRAQVVFYIHQNPKHHNICEDFRTYPHSSYKAILSTAPTHLQREIVLRWFGGHEGFVAYHKRGDDEIIDRFGDHEP